MSGGELPTLYLPSHSSHVHTHTPPHSSHVHTHTPSHSSHVTHTHHHTHHMWHTHTITLITHTCVTVYAVDLNTSPSEWQEIKALKTYEWIQRYMFYWWCRWQKIWSSFCRKMIRRIATPDLMFGHMVAPPPRDVTSQLESLDIADVLNSFTDQGSPTTSELSPITMVTAVTIFTFATCTGSPFSLLEVVKNEWMLSLFILC